MKPTSNPSGELIKIDTHTAYVINYIKHITQHV